MTKNDITPAELAHKMAMAFYRLSNGEFAYRGVLINPTVEMLERSINLYVVGAIIQDNPKLGDAGVARQLSRMLSDDHSSLSELGVQVICEILKEGCSGIADSRDGSTDPQDFAGKTLQ